MTHLKSRSRAILSGATLVLCLFLVGSCNNASGPFDFWGSKPEKLSDLTHSELVRYAYAIQKAVAERPEIILDLHAGEVALMLSKPDLERRDAPSMIWQYRTADCVVDIFFGSTDSESASVEHYEFRQRREQLHDKPVAWSCMNGLYQDRRTIIEAGFQKVYAQIEGTAG